MRPLRKGKGTTLYPKNDIFFLILQVFMVDYGYTAQVSPSELRPLQKPFLKQMCHAFFCHLADIVSSGDMKKWSRTACEFMAEEVQNKKMYIQKKVCILK
jgi:hypothetical protein